METLPFDAVISEKVQGILYNRPLLMDLYHEEDILGEGFNAMVLAIDEYWVIRASLTPKDGWRVISLISHAMRERLNLPRVLATWADAESFPNTVIELSVVERLEELKYGVDYTFESPTLERMNRHWEIPDVDECIPPTEPCYAVIKQAARAFHVLRRMGLMKSISLDLNYSNIMKRKNGVYVLNDPFGTQRLSEEEGEYQ